MPVANCPGLPADDWPPNRIHFRTGHLAGHLAGHQFQKVPYYHEETAKVSPLSGVLVNYRLNQPEARQGSVLRSISFGDCHMFRMIGHGLAG